MAKKVFIKSYGCQMNVYDSARMADVLTPLGYEAVSGPDGADLVILNTCHIREKAAEKVYSELGRIRALKSEKANAPGGGMLVAVAGCVAQAEGEEIFRRAPVVDIVLGPQTYHRLPEMIARAERAASAAGGTSGRGVLDTDFPAEPKFDFLPETASRQGASVFLTIQEGCDKFCSFCVVPYTRGAEYSRPAPAILREARSLVRRGAREITLLGQNVNAYHGAAAHGGDWDLARLIRELAEIDGLERIRYTTSHPRDMNSDLIRAHADVPQLMPYLHLPVQSGSDRVLAAMNRQHTADDYLRIVDALREARPDLALSSDFIVGHPGETEEDFAATLRLIDRVAYAQAYSFKYSARPGTPAAVQTHQLSEQVKAERLARLQDAVSGHQAAFNRRCVGRVMPVLFDRPARRPHQIAGRSPYLQAVHLDCGDAQTARRNLGKIMDVTIVDSHTISLAACIAAPATQSASSGDVDRKEPKAV